MSGVFFVVICCVLLPTEYLRGSLHWVVSLTLGLIGLLIGAMLIGVGNRMIANGSAAKNPLSLTPNSLQQRVWHRIRQFVCVRFPLLGLLGSFVLMIVGATMVFGASIALAKGERANPAFTIGLGAALLSAGFAGLQYLRRNATQKMIDRLRGEVSK